MCDRELKWESDLPYEILTGSVQPWDWGENENRYVNVSDSLRTAMTQNRDLKVFVANGHYDLATPFFATEYTFDHLGLDPTLRNHVSMDFFEAGHMMYTLQAGTGEAEGGYGEVYDFGDSMKTGR